MTPWRTKGQRRNTLLIWCLCLSSVLPLLFQNKLGSAGISNESVGAITAVMSSDRTAWPLLLTPCGHDVNTRNGPRHYTDEREIKRAINSKLDNDYINSHWAESLDAVPVANGKLVHVHHVCVKGGDNGLVVPHLGGLSKAIGYMDRRYFPESSYPTAFREFTFEELLGLFGTTAEKNKYNVKHVNAILVRRLSGSSVYV